MSLAVASRLERIGASPIRRLSEGAPADAIPYKVDFSAFDIDGDALPDGSGRYDTEPVAMRMWVQTDGQWRRLLCALITTRLSDEGIGAGRLYCRPAAVNPFVAESFAIYAM